MWVSRALFFALSLLALPAAAQVSGARVRLGVLAGEENGVSAQYTLNPAQALDVRVLLALFPQPALTFSLSYQFTFAEIVRSDHELPLYVGLRGKGGVAFGGSGGLLGLSVPLGASFDPKGRSFSLFLDVAPGIVFIDGAAFDIDAGLGIRL